MIHRLLARLSQIHQPTSRYFCPVWRANLCIDGTPVVALGAPHFENRNVLLYLERNLVVNNAKFVRILNSFIHLVMLKCVV